MYLKFLLIIPSMGTVKKTEIFNATCKQANKGRWENELERPYDVFFSTFHPKIMMMGDGDDTPIVYVPVRVNTIKYMTQIRHESSPRFSM